jgi:predicted LPLAT superfamily acyltransferase
MSFRPCAVIPSRNHHRVIADVVAGCRRAGLPVYIVDDGSDPPTRAALAALENVELLRLEPNQGKGAAILTGCRCAAAAGFTHAVQVDADGQHDLTVLPRLLELGRAHPEALVLGRPLYDASVPRARAIGRKLTNFWVAVETLSGEIEDAMCGFRLYPIAATLAIADEEGVSLRMGFDIDIAVRVSWRGTPVLNVPVGVTYPEGNTSNFHVLRDNWQITKLHTGLVFAMLARLPSLLRRRARATHWAVLAERGAGWGLRFLGGCYRLAGRRLCTAALLPVVLYFHMTGGERRRASRRYLERALAPAGRRVAWRDGFRHVLDFARKALETVAAWAGDIDPGKLEVMHPEALRRANAAGGAVLIVSHLGNAELSRALLAPERRARLTVLVHTRHAENYNRVLRRLRPEAGINLLQVTEIGPATAIALQERIERGEWIAIAGDRTPLSGEDRVSRVRFFGEEAGFPQGPYILAHLLRCPVYLMFCLREDGRWRLFFEKFADRIDLPRGAKEDALAEHAQRYAERLEAFCRRAPYQWYNFYDFWARP